ncbi:NAD(P)H-flavin reductase [Shewanella sp. Choline-02u-19]|jgi:aquacobalamin reductase/NAD(P)H-flavin reductase|uniref:NAD(P)H-flavin reductase n=1 Tax=Shewanella TaxID=22 RepID=UPI000C3490A4|nr:MULTISPECIES: NAD(P)H-flavin reductase [Shewanella]MCL1056693.1 NAD(P)H-flavin reductase [Shewanella gelidimarina]PKG56911.1 NAD(P)H-flavin reductase [Shewanella sp. GutDb-MelDb]PKG74394.1 NAD(P)H-flavin reductase [Shewanella sp. GutCb]PKH57780.1 NAD(P)H-flavin reductase [Shewanella sp. Bg11-22]PKI29801.1 NAD(P)H-flavin reductase [Shewanella sp. Choline-02u-19]
MNTISCTIEKVAPFNDAVFQVILKSAVAFDFKAGQYLCVVMGETDKRPFSIASAPDSQHLELHIGAAVSESYPMQVVERLKDCLANNSTIEIEIPGGDAHLRHDSLRPRLLIAGGTGFSYIKSIVEHQIALGQEIETTLYWGCRTIDAMYYESIAREWHDAHPWLHFVPVVEEAPSDWNGKQANLLEQLKTDFVSLNGYDIYIAGRFDMVGAAREVFRSMGVEEDHLYGDAFAFIK